MRFWCYFVKINTFLYQKWPKQVDVTKKSRFLGVFGLKNVLKNYFGPIKFWIYTFSYVKLYFNHDSGVILPKKMSLLTKNWPKWSKIAIFVIFWRFFGDNIPKFSKFSKKDVIFTFLTQFYVLKDSIYNYFRKQVFGYLGSNF